MKELLTTIARVSKISNRNRRAIVKSAITDYNMSTSNKENIPEASFKEQEEPAAKSVAIQTEKVKVVNVSIFEINYTRKYKIIEQEEIIKSLGKIYTEGQINKLKHPGPRAYIQKQPSTPWYFYS